MNAITPPPRRDPQREAPAAERDKGWRSIGEVAATVAAKLAQKAEEK